MTVEELIELLKDQPQKAKAYFIGDITIIHAGQVTNIPYRD